MTVAGILTSKGADVVTVAPQETVAEVVATLADRRIGAVLVVDGQGAIAGILTERDVVRALAAHGAAALSKPASAYMTSNVVTAGADATIDQIMNRMTEGKFRHIPIMEGKRLLGIVSIGDVVKHRMAMIEAEASAMRDYIATA
jgi:CBS domain-containing protein